MFILDRGTPSEPAKKVCARCTVTGECGQYATDNHERGDWGGEVHKLNHKAKDVTPVAIEDLRPRMAE